MTDIVLTETNEGITTVTLNRPEHLNALSVELRQKLGEVFIKLRNDTETQVIILTGNGRAFTAGLDLKELGQQGMNTPSSGNETVDLQKAIREVGKPVIGAINGFAITGGFELALACDILIASTEAKFADTHVRMGVVPGWGLSQRLSRLIGASRAKQLSFTGNYLSCRNCGTMGIGQRGPRTGRTTPLLPETGQRHYLRKPGHSERSSPVNRLRLGKFTGRGCR